jgi:hypothetical protein
MHVTGAAAARSGIPAPMDVLCVDGAGWPGSRALETAVQAIDAARAGHGRVVGVLGEPWIGKSALLELIVAHARRAGLVVLPRPRGRGTSAVPFGLASDLSAGGDDPIAGV